MVEALQGKCISTILRWRRRPFESIDFFRRKLRTLANVIDVVALALSVLVG